MHDIELQVINQPLLISALKRCSLALPTDALENLHSVILKYAPKRLHFGFVGMNMRVCLAYIDHNNNVGRQRLETNKFMFSRVTKQWVARTCFAKKDTTWRKDLLRNALLIKLTGSMPPDCQPPFFHISHPKNIFIEKYPMPSKDELLRSKEMNSRNVR